MRTRDVTSRWRRWAAALTELLLLAYGVLRVSVGAALLAQHAGWIDREPLREAVGEVAEFLAARRAQQLVPVSTTGYLLYIVGMGLLLVVGAVRSWSGRRWSVGLLWAYLAMHGMLFVNFRTVNRKVVYLAGGIGLLLALQWLKRDPEESPRG